MANTIRIKRRAAGGSAGAPSSLKNAELAYNEQDNILYYGFGDAGGGNASSIIVIGGKGAFVDLTTNQTIGGVKTFSSQITGSISGNAGTATALATSRSISITGDMTWTVNFDGSGNATAAGTLATVNGNTGTFTKLTVNAKGLVTAASQASRSDLSAPTADISNGGFKITNVADPVNAQDAATKNYVDNVATGLDWKASVRVATTAALAITSRTSTTLTLGGTSLTIDGQTMANGDRVLVKNSTTGTGAGTWDNGLYTVGGIGSSVVLTRATDGDTWGELPGSAVFVEVGTANSDTGWVCTIDQGGTLGTTAITFAQFSGSGTYTAGNGLTLTGNTFDVVGTTNRISVAADSIDIDAAYVGQTSITTLGTIATGTWSAMAIAVNKGGTNITSYAVGDMLYADGATSLAKLAAVATGNVLISGGVTTAPSWGKVGLTTHVSGQLGVGNGGTGLNAAPANGQLLIGNGGTSFSLATLTQGSGITITNGAGSISIANAAPMVYPGAGIANSTGSAWGTSYTTSGSGTVVALATGATLTAPLFSTSATVTAGTNAQGQGALTSDVNVITTTAANPSGVTLPTTAAGREIWIVNKGTNPINIYPPSGSTIDALAANASIQLAVGAVMWFNAVSSTQWYSSYNSAVTGTGVTSISFGSIGLTPSSPTGGAVVVGGTLGVGNGGTGASSFTSNGIIYGNASGALQVTAAGAWDGTNLIGQLLSVNSSGVPTWTNTIDCGTF